MEGKSRITIRLLPPDEVVLHGEGNPKGAVGAFRTRLDRQRDGNRLIVVRGHRKEAQPVGVLAQPFNQGRIVDEFGVIVGIVNPERVLRVPAGSNERTLRAFPFIGEFPVLI